MLKVITVVQCDGDGCQAEIRTMSHIAQVDLIELAARESGWVTQETRRKKHPKWLCPNCTKTIIADDTTQVIDAKAKKAVESWYQDDLIGQDEEESE